MWGDLPEATSVVVGGLGAPGKSLDDAAIQERIEKLTQDVADSSLTYPGASSRRATLVKFSY